MHSKQTPPFSFNCINCSSSVDAQNIYMAAKNKSTVKQEKYANTYEVEENGVKEDDAEQEPPKLSFGKTLSIEKGQVTQLKEIPNGAFKLSKKEVDETLQLLHDTLFGEKSKVHEARKNIGLFSCIIEDENMKQQREKLKEKIGKCLKEILLDFCDVLDIPVNKFATKKEICDKLFDFLEPPTKKGKKRKGEAAIGTSPAFSKGKSKTKQKLDDESGKKPRYSIEEDNKNEAESDLEEEPYSDDDKASETSMSTVEAEPPSKKQKAYEESEEDDKEVPPKRKLEAVKKHPSRVAIKSVITDILVKEKLNKATISDVRRQLEMHFAEDLLHRKAEIVAMLKEVINRKLFGDYDSEETESDDESGKDDGEVTETAEEPGKDDSEETETADEPEKDDSEETETETADELGKDDSEETETADEPEKDDSEETETADELGKDDSEETETADELGKDDSEETETADELVKDDSEENETETHDESEKDDSEETESEWVVNGEKKIVRRPSLTGDESGKDDSEETESDW